jgi:AcrR family transcriptional regulator
VSPPVLTRRDRKRLATREAIRSAAVELFIRHGFDAVSVEEVAEAADVGASTVYRHFPTKEDLVLGRLRDRQREFVELLVEVDDARTVGELLVVAAERWAPDEEEQQLLRGEIRLAVATPGLLARLQHQVVEWEAPIVSVLAARSGRPEDDLALRQLTALFCATVRIVIREWVAADGVRDLADFGRGAVEALDHLPASGLGILDR